MRLVARAAVQALVALVSTSSFAPLFAQGWIVPRPCVFGSNPRGPWPDRPPVNCNATIERTRSDVRVEMADRVLRYEVEERFVNRGGSLGEADYLFPLPAGAAFQGLELSIDGELVSGETMNADSARTIYERIVRTQRDPALVEWMGHGLLRARIFPLNPGEEKRVVVRFQSVAQREGDALRVDYFRGASQGATSVRDGGMTSFTLSYRASSDFGAPYSPTHSLDVSDRDGRRQVAVRGDARDLTLLIPVQRSTAASISMLPYSPGNEDGFALVTITPPRVDRSETTPRDVTLVLDVSGSMQGRKIEQARAAGRQLLATLRPDDRFRLIDFSSDVRTFRDDFVQATSDNIRDATRYLDALEAQGGTNIEGALREAVRPPVASGRLPLVLFITDGEPTIGMQQPDQLAGIASPASRTSGPQRRIFTFGLGSDVNVSLLEQLALDGRGTSQFVRPDESVERMVGIVAGRLVDPVLTDVRVHAEGGVALSRMLPAQPADVFADRDLVLLARYSGHGSANIVVEGNRRGTPIRFSTTVDFPDRERNNPFVGRLWATQRVGFLTAEKHRNGGSREVDDEIRALGERFGIPTELTSYLVMEPRLAMNNGRVQLSTAVATGAAMPAPAMRDMRFESAKAASAQRAVSSLATADSISMAATVAASPRSPASNGTRVVDGHPFRLQDGVWTDVRFNSTISVTKVVAYSKAYFDLLRALPELRAAFALGNRVVVVGRKTAIAVGDDGASELAPATIATLARSW